MSRSKRGQERAEQRRQEQQRQKRAALEAKREASRNASMVGMANAAAAAAKAAAAMRPVASTFGAFMRESGLLQAGSEATRALNGHVAEGVKKLSVVRGPVSCEGCTARKGCCWMTTVVYLHEAVPIAARLINEGRDGFELRQKLAASADEMESTPRDDYDQPCIFLDADERCTIYEDRPTACGFHFVYSAPELCSTADPSLGVLELVNTSAYRSRVGSAAHRFAQRTGLPSAIHGYSGALPRMVLVCLEAWERSDYTEFLAEHVGRAAFKISMMLPAD